MPIYVQWKWKELTKSFLVIFHFHDDFSKSNLRLQNPKQVRQVRLRDLSISLEDVVKEAAKGRSHMAKSKTLPVKAYMTWAPSHPELGFLSEVLRYANLIGGLDELTKRDVRPYLEGEGSVDNIGKPKFRVFEPLLSASRGLLIGIYQEEPFFCCELCDDYIHYLDTLWRKIRDYLAENE